MLPVYDDLGRHNQANRHPINVAALSDSHLALWAKMTQSTLAGCEARLEEMPQDAWRKANWEAALNEHYTFINEIARRAAL